MNKLLVLVAFVLFLIAGLLAVSHADFSVSWEAFVAFGLASWAASSLVP